MQKWASLEIDAVFILCSSVSCIVIILHGTIKIYAVQIYVTGT